MLKKILSISGKSGLFRMVSQGKNMYVAESLVDKKRIPVYPRDKVISLGDIAIYTNTEEVPLSDVLSRIQKKQNDAIIDNKNGVQPAELRAYFEEVLPDFDRERVYPSDIKKVMNWYNILITAGYKDFSKNEASEEKTDEEVENKDEEVIES